jgi:hypothetical protein
MYMLKCANKNTPKNAAKFYCEKCDFKCSKNSDYSRHILTPKHNNAKNANTKDADYICDVCSNEFKHASSLSRHKKKCKAQHKEKNIEMSPILDQPEIIDFLINENKEFKNENKEFKNVIIDLMKSNSELQKQMLEVCKTSAYQTTHINNHSNSHNKTFNLQFFLNETCKDAMNIMDFVDSFTLQLSDLEDVSKQGYVDGISNIIMKKLNELDVHKRPIHCSDAKREIMYVKDQNKWEKEDLGYAKLRKAIKYISKKNSDLLGQWSEAHPASKNITTQTNTEYMKMIVQAMGGRGEIGENESKIIKKIARTVLIEKD